MVKTSPSVTVKPSSKRIFTKQQKEKLIKRFQNELSIREANFKSAIESEISLLHLKFNNRLNKILRKFWDVKLIDILNVERELTKKDHLTLVNIIKQLESSKK